MSQTKRNFRYGWKPDHADIRDKMFSVAKPTILPPYIDLRPFCSPVFDQGELGSCTSNALSAAISYLDIKDKLPLIIYSRLFIYYNERSVEGTVNSDSGAQIRDGIKVLNTMGACSETLWPYNISKFTVKPPANCYATAKAHSVVTYSRLLSLNDMRTCLSKSYPFVFGFSVYESFESQQVAQTGIVPMPQPNERLLGGHAVMAVGYDDYKKSLIVRNSWGTDWGIKGYFYLPYDFVTTNLSSDFWTIQKTKSE